MKSGDCADVEAAELRSLLAQRYVHAGHFGQVLVFGGAGHLSPQVADWHDLKGDEDRYEHPDEWSSGHVRSLRKDAHWRKIGVRGGQITVPYFGKLTVKPR
jgi:hypothetical protein